MTAKSYANEHIEVSFDSEVCVHAQYCIHGLPDVFDVNRRPWILVDGATADATAEQVRKCPSGALQYRRLDGQPDETPDVPATVTALRNGPLALRGDLDIRSADGTLLRHDTRVVLCRCGGSGHKPFCDGTHRTNGFTAD